MKRRGKFIVTDGLDGIGKGTIESAVVENLLRARYKVFDAVGYAIREGDLVDGSTLKDYNLMLNAEPTRAWMGKAIRTETTATDGRQYTASENIQAFSLDRLINMQRTVLPFLNAGGHVIQSRSVASTLCYQSLQAELEGRPIDEVRQEILAHRGNKIQLQCPIDLLIIPTIKDVKELNRRLAAREKQDGCRLEELKFQEKLKPFYESKWFKIIFESYGTIVKYLDAGISVEHTKAEGIRIVKEFLEL